MRVKPPFSPRFCSHYSKLFAFAHWALMPKRQPWIPLFESSWSTDWVIDVLIQFWGCFCGDIICRHLVIMSLSVSFDHCTSRLMLFACVRYAAFFFEIIKSFFSFCNRCTCNSSTHCLSSRSFGALLVVPFCFQITHIRSANCPTFEAVTADPCC